MNARVIAFPGRNSALPGLVTLLVLALHLGSVGLNAQNVVLSVTPSTSSIVLGESVTYTLNLTNRFLFSLQNVFVTNTPSQTVTFTSPITSQGFFTNAGSSGVFYVGNLFSGAGARMSFTVRPTNTGTFTDSISVFDFAFATNLVTTNVAVTVTAPQSDLGVTLATSSQSLLVNDQLNYTITVTNGGATPVTGVQLTNTFPGARLLSASPQGQSTSFPLVFNLGTLASRSATTVTVNAQATNAGTLSLSAVVGASGFSDSNPSNNTATSTITVSSSLPGQLTATNVSGMALNPQTGLMEQTVRLSNVGTNPVPAARLMVSGLTNVLRNAVGTNNGSPYVLYAAALAVGRSVDLKLQYFIPTRLPISVPNSSYSAIAVPAPDLSASGTATNVFAITRALALANGSALIEFPATPGANYTVLYSSDSSFTTNVLAAQPSITAPADRVQWIDDGPPKTDSLPASASPRFYRVRRN